MPHPRCFRVVAFALAAVLFAALPTAARVAVYEARISSSKAPVTISYRLNSSADVTINIRQHGTGDLVQTLGPFLNESAGAHSHDYDGSGMSGTPAAGVYYAEIAALGRVVTKFSTIVGPVTGAGGDNSPKQRWYGIAVNTNPDSEYYGYIYVPDKAAKRVRAFHPDGEFAFDFDSVGTSFWGGSAPWGAWVDKDGLVYVGDRSKRKLHQFSAKGKLMASGSSGSYIRGVTGRNAPEGTEIWISSETGLYRALCTPGVIGTAEAIVKTGATLGAGLYGAAVKADGSEVLTSETDKAAPDSVKVWSADGINLTYSGNLGQSYRLDSIYGLESGSYWLSGAKLRKLVPADDQPATDYSMPSGNSHKLALDVKGNILATYGYTGAAIGYPYFALFAEPDPLNAGGKPVASTDSIVSPAFGIETDPWPVLVRYKFAPDAIPADGITETTLQVVVQDGTGQSDIQSVKIDLGPIGGGIVTLTKSDAIDSLNQAVFTASKIVCTTGIIVGRKNLTVTMSDGKNSSSAAVTLRIAGDANVSGQLRNFYDKRALTGPGKVMMDGGTNPKKPQHYEAVVRADGSFNITVKEGYYTITGNKPGYNNVPIANIVAQDAEIQADAYVSPLNISQALALGTSEAEIIGTVSSPASAAGKAGLNGVLYLRDSSGSNGADVNLRVEGAALSSVYVALWRQAMVSGSLKTINGEKVFQATTIMDVGKGSFPPGESINASDLPGVSSGKLVSIRGAEVVQSSTADGWFDIRDGSGIARVCLLSGQSTKIGIPAVGAVVSVTGVADKYPGGGKALYPALPEFVKVSDGVHPEYRGFWADAFHAGFKSRAAVDQLIADVHRANANFIVVQVRKRGDTYFPSPIDPFAPDADPSFDALAYLVEKAHAAVPPIEIHAWAATLPVVSGSTLPTNPAHVVNTHPEFLTQSDTGAKFDGSNYVLDPGHPGAQQYVCDVYMDMISRYDIDAIHFDMVRFVGANWGYNPVSVSRFNAAFGRTGQPAYNDPDWMQWRRDQVTAMVRKIYLSAIAIKPHMKVGGSTITWGNGPSDDDEWYGTSAYASVFQDWRAWMEEGILDINMPMTYYRDYSDTYAAYYNNWINFEKDHKYSRHLAVGLGVYLNDIPGSLSQIRRAMAPNDNGQTADGTIQYSYAVTNMDYLPNSLFYNSLTNINPYEPGTTPVWFEPAPLPAMPWKSPTEAQTGHLMGKIISFDTGKQLEGASIEVIGPETRLIKSDLTGFYGAVGLKPGLYLLKASAKGAAQQIAQAVIKPALVTVQDFGLGANTSRMVPHVNDIRNAQLSERLALVGKIAISGKADWSQTLYISEPDRSAGVRADFSNKNWPAVTEGDIINISGIKAVSVDGEIVLSDAQVSVTGHQTPLKAITIANKHLMVGLQPDMSCLLVKAWGQVTGGDSDGWTISDGTLPGGSIRVSKHGAGVPATGTWVTIQGVCGVENTTGILRRIIRPRNEADLATIAASQQNVPAIAAWQIFSPVGALLDDRPEAMFDPDYLYGNLYRYNARYQSLEMWPNWQRFGVGEGCLLYWCVPENISYSSLDVQGTDDFWIPLSDEGWSLIGPVGSRSVRWGDCIITDGLKAIPISHVEAESDLVSFELQGYINGTTVLIGPGGILVPGNGYWLYAKKAGLGLILKGGSLDDVEKPAAPTNLAVSSGAVQTPSFSLSWKPSTGFDVKGYNVYRRLAAEDTFTLIGTATGPPSYIDTAVPVPAEIDGMDYYVTAVNTAGESDPSNIFTIPGSGG